MSEIKLISPILDGYVVGDPISDHNGVCSYPAINESTDEKYIVKVISVPPSQTQLDALVLSGAYQTKEDALKYYESLASEIIHEAETLEQLAKLEGFMPFDAYQLVPMDDGNGFQIYIRNNYKLSLARKFAKEPMTHLGVLNLGLDLCAALAVCRRSGFLYVDLKPENIYITVDNGYRIGDIGFLNLNTLRYASLPDRYRSAYTAPELSDPFASLNETMDVYAVGLILYQAFNGGVLPPLNDGETLPPPDYADYEMAEIILKACALNPADRWETPVELGNALVCYMQKNGAHDTPIVPPTIPVEAEIPVEEPIVEEAVEQETETETTAPALSAIVVPDDDDETQPGADTEDLDYEQVSEEVTVILNQADDLIAHETPDPVTAPDPVDVEQLAEEVIEEAASNESEDSEDDTGKEDVCEEETSDTVCENSKTDDVQEENIAASSVEDTDDVDDSEEKPKRRWILITALIVAIIALLTAGIFYYKFVYVQQIDEMTLEGSGNHLTVYVKTNFDESKLIVVCSDTYNQNHREAELVNGVAQFTDLPLDSPFTITVKAKGFHTLKGETTKSYATPKATQVISFEALTGHDDGSVNLSFTVSGPDSSEWFIDYYAQDTAANRVSCVGHTATVTDLEVGKVYTFVLSAADDVQLVDKNLKIEHTAAVSVIAENMHINAYQDGKLTVSWTASVPGYTGNWQVFCSGNTSAEHNDAKVTETTSAVLEDLSENTAYTITVRADGMHDGASIEVPASPVKLQNIQATTENGTTTITWDCSDPEIDDNWILQCTNQSSFIYSEASGAKSIILSDLVPGAEYHFILNHEDDAVNKLLVGNCLNYTVPTGESLDLDGISTDTFGLYKKDTSTDEFVLTDSFQIGDEAALGAVIPSKVAKNNPTILYVVKDSSGKIMNAVTQSEDWDESWIWKTNGNLYGKLRFPYLPDIAGDYNICVYFDGALLISKNFPMTN